MRFSTLMVEGNIPQIISSISSLMFINRDLFHLLYGEHFEETVMPLPLGTDLVKSFQRRSSATVLNKGPN